MIYVTERYDFVSAEQIPVTPNPFQGEGVTHPLFGSRGGMGYSEGTWVIRSLVQPFVTWKIKETFFGPETCVSR